jgi:hypothetical protein
VNGMRPALAPILMALVASGLGCRQIAGLEDISLADAGADARVDVEAGVDAGACGCPGCTVLASGLNRPLSLTRVGTELYALSYGPVTGTGMGSLIRGCTPGGPVVKVEDQLTRPLSITADATNLYWMAEDGHGGGTVVKRPLAGGPVVTLAAGFATPQMILFMGSEFIPENQLLALTGKDLYFIANQSAMAPSVVRVPIDGGPAVTLFAGAQPDAGLAGPLAANGIATDGESLFILVNNFAFLGIVKAPLPDGPLVAIVSNLIAPAGFTLSGNDVLYVDDGLAFQNGTVQTVPKSGGAPKVLTMGLKGPWNVVVDHGLVYCTEIGPSPGAGAILKVDLDGGAATEVVSHILDAVALVTDSENLYWVDGFCGTVMKAHR